MSENQSPIFEEEKAQRPPSQQAILVHFYLHDLVGKFAIAQNLTVHIIFKPNQFLLQHLICFTGMTHLEWSAL